MLTLKLALRTIERRKGRMALIGVLVAFGTFLIVFGGTVATSAGIASRQAIIENFTGDFIVYSGRSRELPSPFAFNTPLPNIRNVEAVTAALSEIPEVEAYTTYAQNYGIIQVVREGKAVDLPFIFYAVDPEPYAKVFRNISVTDGSYYRPGTRGVLISRYQNEQYMKNYGVELKAGDSVTVLGVTEGGVNTVRSELLGLFEPRRFTSVFNYINFVDTVTYSELYNYTGVTGLPDSFNEGLDAALADEDSLFGLADDEAFGRIDLSTLDAEALSGFTMIAVKLKDHDAVDRVMAALTGNGELGIRAARWDEASGFYAQISSSLQAFIFLAVALIFLVVTLIFMNTLIINVVERTAEIGTLRAMGADKSFIRGLFLTETLILNVTAALVSMAAAGTLLAVFGKSGLPLPETVSQFLIGGGPLALHADIMPFLTALIVVIAVSVLATIYPVQVATRITPLRAMSDR